MLVLVLGFDCINFKKSTSNLMSDLMSMRVIIFLIVVFFNLPTSANEDLEEKGKLIAESAYKAASGYGGYLVSVEMKNTDHKGRSNSRVLKITVAESEGGHKNRIKVFQPEDLKGTSVLSYSYSQANKHNDQWIYLPSQNKVRRLVSGRRTGSFLGSQLTYEDLIPKEVDKYRYLFIRDESCPVSAENCHVLQRFPKLENTGYSSQLVWINIETLVTDRVIYLGSSEEQLKILDNMEYEKYEGKYWQPLYTKVVNVKSKKSTELRRSSFTYDKSHVKEDIFHPARFYD